MIDFILFCFFIGAFAGGFYCGKTYSTVGQMIDRWTAVVKGWLA